MRKKFIGKEEIDEMVRNNECPNRDCREELKVCIVNVSQDFANKVSALIGKKAFITFITIFATLVCMAVGGPLLYSMASEKKQNEKIAKIEVIQLDIKYIKKALVEQKVELKQYQRDQKEAQKESQKIILDAIKDLKKKVESK